MKTLQPILLQTFHLQRLSNQSYKLTTNTMCIVKKAKTILSIASSLSLFFYTNHNITLTNHYCINVKSSFHFPPLGGIWMMLRGCCIQRLGQRLSMVQLLLQPSSSPPSFPSNKLNHHWTSAYAYTKSSKCWQKNWQNRLQLHLFTNQESTF